MASNGTEWQIVLFKAKLEKDMFIGSHTQKMDTKGRVVVPFKFRDEMGSKVIITRGEKGKCLYAFSEEGFANFFEKIHKLPMLNKKANKFNRFFLAGADSLDTDKLGRVSVPSELRLFAQLDKEVVWVGMGDRVEIWGVDKWSVEDSQMVDGSDDEAFDMEAILEELSNEYGI